MNIYPPTMDHHMRIISLNSSSLENSFSSTSFHIKESSHIFGPSRQSHTKIKNKKVY
jgi:hypothetical protein